MTSAEFGSVTSDIIDVDGVRSIAMVAVAGLNRPMINHGSDMRYEVTCGEGYIEVDFTVKELRPGSVVDIPAGTPYQDEAVTPRLVMRATATPPFDPDRVEYLA